MTLLETEHAIRNTQQWAERPRLRFLEVALLLSLVAHLLAMLSMAALLIPGMPGSSPLDVAGRVAYIGDHPWIWRLGWLPWHLSAIADLLLGVALWRLPGVPRLAAAVTLALTVIAILPDQGGQLLWETQGVARSAGADRAAYLAWEAPVFAAVAGWGALFYSLAALGWTWCFRAAGLWVRGFGIYSAVLWGLFLIASFSALAPGGLGPLAPFVPVMNAVGFVLMLGWLAAVTELLLRRSRPLTTHGRYAAWTHPGPWPARPFTWLANSLLVRAVFELIPPVAFVSDITDVIYINYLVEATRMEAWVPPGLELQRVGPGGQWAAFSSLSYRHGHFGPALLGPLRRLLPSPVQTNWRVYVRDPRTGREGIYFVTNAIDWTPHALAARLMSEGMPMHVIQRARLDRAATGEIDLVLDPGAGSAPDVTAHFTPLAARPSSGPWQAAFPTYEAMLAYIVPQDRAFSVQPWYGRVTRQEIALGIPLAICEPLAGRVQSRAATAIVGDAEPFCFRVPRVAFRFDREERDRLT